MEGIAGLVSSLEQGDRAAEEELLRVVYDELRRLAAHRLAQERPGHTLQATALVHEAYVRLMDSDAVRQWNGRDHFFAAAAEAMRWILIDNARRRHSIKRGGQRRRVGLECAELAVEPPSATDLLAVNEALQKLETLDRRKAELVKLRYFAGLSREEAANALGISLSTADNDWAYARAWLRAAMEGQGGGEADPEGAAAGSQQI